MEKIMGQMDADPRPPFVPNIVDSAQSSNRPGAVSVAQLRHPLSRKGFELIQTLLSYLNMGQREKAQAELVKALQEPSAAPYAHAILGTEYLMESQVAAAVPELENAAQVLPISSVHSNLGYALCMTGQSKRGQRELEEALRLDGESSKARYLMGVLLLNQKSREQEAQFDLKLAEGHIPEAHLALAVCHLRRGERAAAKQQVEEYLGADRNAEFYSVWVWVSAAAAAAHPAHAFGFPDQGTD
jgi:Tfp pilus assembly protein PilF